MNKYIVWLEIKKRKHYKLHVPKIIKAKEECEAIYKYICFYGGLPLHKTLEEFREFYNKNGSGFYKVEKIHNDSTSEIDMEVEKNYERAMNFYKRQFFNTEKDKEEIEVIDLRKENFNSVEDLQQYLENKTYISDNPRLILKEDLKKQLFKESFFDLTRKNNLKRLESIQIGEKIFDFY